MLDLSLYDPAFVIAAASLALSVFGGSWLLAGAWIRKNIPLPEDYRGGPAREGAQSPAQREAKMLAEFEHIRKAHEAKRRKPVTENKTPGPIKDLSVETPCPAPPLPRPLRRGRK